MGLVKLCLSVFFVGRLWIIFNDDGDDDDDYDDDVGVNIIAIVVVADVVVIDEIILFANFTESC